MNIIDLANFLDLEEGPTLEFKRDMYAIYSENGRISIQQKGELIKDILSLANGCFDTIGQDACLIVGVEDLKDEEGKRRIIGIEGKTPQKNDILNMIREASNPPLQDLYPEVIDYQGKNLWVITIPASPSVYETKKVLETPKTNHFAHMVFIRRNSTIDNASTNERKSLERLKKITMEERVKVPTVLAMALGGAYIIGSIMSKNSEKITEGKVSNRSGLFFGIILGIISGGSIGIIMEKFSKSVYETRKMLLRISRKS